MGKIGELLDKAKKTRSIPSDMALAGVFGVHRQAVSKWRTGDAYPSQDHIARLAEMAGEEAAKWLVVVQAERETGAAGRAWQQLARQLGAAASIALMVSLTALPARASDSAELRALTEVGSMHYAKLRKRLACFIRRVFGWRPAWSRAHAPALLAAG